MEPIAWMYINQAGGVDLRLKPVHDYERAGWRCLVREVPLYRASDVDEIFKQMRDYFKKYLLDQADEESLCCTKEQHEDTVKLREMLGL